jgi:multidrug efflux system outer membrane protein
MRVRRSVLILTALIVSACKVGPNFKPPAEPVPDQYAGVKAQPPPPAPQPPPAPRPSDDSGPPSFWWREFHDPELDDLVDKARRGNLDLKGAYLRIVEARLQVQAARAQGLPSLGASAAYTREQLGLAGILKSKGIDTASGPASSAAALCAFAASTERRTLPNRSISHEASNPSW